MLNFLYVVGWLLPLAILYILFRFSFGQVKGVLVRILLISFLLYVLLFYITFLYIVAACLTGGACYGSTPDYVSDWLGYMGIGWGMFIIPPLFVFLNGLLFATKKSIGANFFVRFITGASIAFILWLVGAIILAFLGFTLGD